jgi:hypothetical protein
MENSWGLVTTAFDRGIDALNTLGDQKYEISWDAPDIEAVESPSVEITSIEPPELEDIPENVVPFSGIIPTTNLANISTVSISGFNEKDYGFSISEITIPSAPSITVPAVPHLDSITIPAPPEYHVTDFEGIPPVDDLIPPVLSFEWGESLYSSNLKTKLGDWLYDQIVSGGTGLDEATEQAIYSRAKSRLEEESQALLDSINDGMAAKGFPLPLGAYGASILEAENKILRSRTDLNNDILVQQSKLAQDNTHFVITEATKLESVLIEYHNQVQNRSLDAAKFIVTTTAQLYAIRLDGYKAKMEAYGILAQVYQARIQGEIAKAEFYKAQIAGVQASVEVQRSLIDAYTAQIGGIRALIEIYVAQMQGANIQAGIDRTRMEGFVSEVQAYGARVSAELAKYEGYKARISGEALKVEMAKTDAEAYVAKVSGYKAKIDAEVAVADANLANTRAQIEVFSGLLQKYNTDIQASLARADIFAKKEGLKVDIYKAQSAVYETELDALIKAYLGKVDEVKSNSDLSIRASEVALQSLLSKYQLTSENLRAVAQVAGQMSAAAAASVNASISANASESKSDTNSFSNSNSYNASDSDSNSTVTEQIHQYSN